MSINVLKWDNIYTSCGVKPCFYFKPDLEMAGKLLEEKPENQTTFPIEFTDSDMYNGVHRVTFDKSNLDNTVYVGILQIPFKGVPHTKKSNCKIYTGIYYKDIPNFEEEDLGMKGVKKFFKIGGKSVEKFKMDKKEKMQFGVDVGIMIIIFLAIMIVCYEITGK